MPSIAPQRSGLRKWFGRLCSAALCCALLPAQQAAAAGPQLKTSAPGWYRMMLGDFEVTALSDGTFDLHAGQLLTNTTAARIHRALARAYLKDPVETSVNAFLINTGSKLVLIDTDASASSNHLSTVKPIPPKNRAFATAATLDEPSS